MSDRRLTSISYLVPCFNEEESIRKTLQSLEKELNDLGLEFEIILINDGSKDKTVEIAKSACPYVKIISHPVNVGYGASLKTGVRAAKYDWIGIVDGDGTYDLASLPKLVEEANQGFDMVVAEEKTSPKLMDQERKSLESYLA